MADLSLMLENVKNRKHFHRNLFRKELVVLMVSTIMVLIWVILIMIVAADHMRTVPSFFACSSDGLLTPLNPMSQPNRSDKAILE